MTSKPTPQISVIMPVYNAEKYVEEAINSILKQSFGDFELLIIDDCGTDASMDIVRQIRDERIVIFQNDCNRGIAFSRNHGISEARGKYIALMDDDDIASANRFELELAYLDSHKDIDVVGGGVRDIDSEGKVISLPYQVICNHNRIKAELIFRDVIANGSVMFRKDFVQANKIMFRDGYLGMEDYKFWTECSVLGKIANLDEILLYWRRTDNAETSRVKNGLKAERKKLYAKIQQEALSMNGFRLTESELSTFSEMFQENKKEFTSIDQLHELHGLMEEMIRQAKEMPIDNLNEFSFVCKSMFAMKTINCEIWSK